MKEKERRRYDEGVIEDEREYATLIGEGRMVLQATPYRHSLSHTYCYLAIEKERVYK